MNAYKGVGSLKGGLNRIQIYVKCYLQLCIGSWGDLGVDGWIILGWISRRWDVGMWTGLGWPRIGTGGAYG